MMVSSRGRYALRVMTDLAEHRGEGYIAMRQVAERQGISLKYLGGYRLTREPDMYPVSEILRLTEGDIAPVACLDCSTETCSRSAECRTRPMWDKLNSLVDGYLSSVTIADLMEGPQSTEK